jgi:hypothetical protein
MLQAAEQLGYVGMMHDPLTRRRFRLPARMRGCGIRSRAWLAPIAFIDRARRNLKPIGTTDLLCKSTTSDLSRGRKNRTHTLRHAVDFLDGLGYHTYYAGRSLLMPLWGSHWREPYGVGRWSDMVALQAHSSFERYFLRQFLPGPPCPG